jgi:hypothetical protein
MTLLEVLVVMTGVATMLGLCAVTIQLLLRLNADGQARLAASTALDRLASQFRQDVHACDGVQIGGRADGQPAAAAARLKLTWGPQLVVTYEAREEAIARVESVSGKTNRHESYHLDRGSAVQFEARDEGPRRFLVMVVVRRGGKEPLEPSRSIEVLALRGKDRIGTGRAEGDQPR